MRAARGWPPGPLWWEELPRANASSRPTRWHCSVRSVATGEMYDTVGQFYTLATGGGVNIFQPEPMRWVVSPPLAVAHRHWHTALDRPTQAAGRRDGGSLQLAACGPPDSGAFDAFNPPWVRDLVTWHPRLDPDNGHLSLPDAPGLGLDLNMDVARAHPYDPKAYLNIYQNGWEKRLGQTTETPAAP